MDKILKILSGIHLGAQLEVPVQRRLVIGTSDDCDVVLDDSLVAPEHIQLEWDGAESPVKLTFRRAGFVGEEEVAAGQTISLSDYQAVTIGATQLAVGTEGGAWTAVVLPAWQALHATLSQSEEPPAPEKSSNQTDDVGTDSESDSAETSEGEKPVEEQLPVASAATEPPLRKSRPWLNLWAGLLLVLFAICGFMLVPFLSPGENKAMADTAGNITSIAKDIDAEVRSACARLGLTCTKNKSGRWTASGLMKDNASLDAAKKELRSISSNLDFQVTSDARILDSAEQVIKGFGFPMTVETSDKGHLSLTGAAPSEQDLEYVITRLRSDVPGIKNFNVNVELLSRVSDDLTSELVSLKLRDVKLELTDGLLLAKGSLPSTKADSWHKKLSEWKKKYHSIKKVEDRTEVVPISEAVVAALDEATSPVLASPIASIQMMPLASFQTRDGQVFYPNAIIGNGYIVDSITQAGIWIRSSDAPDDSKSWISLGEARPRKD